MLLEKEEDSKGGLATSIDLEFLEHIIHRFT